MDNSSSDSEEEVVVNEKVAEDGLNQPKREILCRDSIEWLSEMEEGFPPGYCGFTSLPDISELQQSMFAAGQIEEYKAWFEDAVALFMSKLPERSFVIFLQSDIRVVVNNQVEQWVDKSHLCSSAADRSGCVMMWHKLVLLNDNLIKRSAARPTYSHLICYAKRPTALSRNYISAMNDIRHSLADPLPVTSSSSPMASPPRIKINASPPSSSGAAKKVPDIFYRGEMVWSKGIGLDCCYIGVAFLKEVCKATCIVDPFAGQGTVLAMANALGVDALGVEISTKRCRKAKTLNLKDKLHLVSASLKNISLELIHEREADRVERSKKHLPRNSGNEDSIIEGTMKNSSETKAVAEAVVLSASSDARGADATPSFDATAKPVDSSIVGDSGSAEDSSMSIN